MKDEYDFTHAVRGPVLPPQPGTSRVTIRLDDEVLEWFREQVHAAGGGDYQRLMNGVLRAHVDQRETLEGMLRRVIREEIAAAGVSRQPGSAPIPDRSEQ